MKVLLALAVLCFLQQGIADQVTKEDHKIEQPNEEELHAALLPVSDYQAHNTHVNANKQQHAADESQQHAAEHEKPTVKIEHSHSEPSKVSVEIPPNVQQIVTQVSQHIPQVVSQHVASHQRRVVRAIKNRLAWQTMQVNAAENPGKCEFMCNQQDLTVCGHNGRCYWEFESQCDLSTYNCLNTDKIFEIVDFAKCQDVSAAKCYRGDM